MEIVFETPHGFKGKYCGNPFSTRERAENGARSIGLQWNESRSPRRDETLSEVSVVVVKEWRSKNGLSMKVKRIGNDLPNVDMNSGTLVSNCCVCNDEIPICDINDPDHGCYWTCAECHNPACDQSCSESCEKCGCSICKNCEEKHAAAPCIRELKPKDDKEPEIHEEDSVFFVMERVDCGRTEIVSDAYHTPEEAEEEAKKYMNEPKRAEIFKWKKDENEERTWWTGSDSLTVEKLRVRNRPTKRARKE